MDIKETTKGMLGTARQVIIDKENTTIIEGAGDPAEIKARINSIKVQIEDTTSDYDREKLQERLAKLSGGIAVIQVGAVTETEMKEAKMRIEDALSATRAAVEEGIIPGGGITLLALIPAIGGVAVKEEGDIRTGMNIVMRSLEEPIRQIVYNAGVEGATVVANVLRSGDPNYGYDANANEYFDMTKRGIIDPTKVSRSALQNAASVAAMLLTTESIVCDIPVTENAPANSEMPMY